MNKINTLLKVTVSNAKNLLRAAEDLPTPISEKECYEYEDLITVIQREKNTIPHGDPYNGVHRMLTWSINHISAKINEYKEGE